MKEHELDKILRQLANDARLDDTSANEIADSPTLWWNVQREIRNADRAKSASWPPNFLQKLLMFGGPVTAAVLLGLGLYMSSVRTPAPDTARTGDPASQNATDTGKQNVT